MNLKPKFFLLIIRRTEDFVYQVNESSAGGEVKYRRSMHDDYCRNISSWWVVSWYYVMGWMTARASCPLQRNGESC